MNDGMSKAFEQIFSVLLTIPVTVKYKRKRRSVQALVDLGATMTIFSPKLCGELGLPTCVGGYGQQAGGAGLILSVTEPCVLTAEAGPAMTHEFASVDLPTLAHLPGTEVVLGMDYLMAAGAVIDVAKRAVRFRRKKATTGDKLVRYNFDTGEPIENKPVEAEAAVDRECRWKLEVPDKDGA